MTNSGTQTRSSEFVHPTAHDPAVCSTVPSLCYVLELAGVNLHDHVNRDDAQEIEAAMPRVVGEAEMFTLCVSIPSLLPHPVRTSDVFPTRGLRKVFEAISHSYLIN